MEETIHEHSKIIFTSNNTEKLKKILDYWNTLKNDNTTTNQSTLKNNNTTSKKYFCNNPECKKEITKEVVAYCLFKDNNGHQKYGGKVYCRDCQEAQ